MSSQAKSRRPRGAEPRRPKTRNRKGSVAVLSAALMIVMMAMVAFSVDVGFVALVHTELQRAVDAGALAGAGTLVNGAEEAQSIARRYVQMNPVATQTVTNGDIETTTGHWDETSRSFIASTEVPSAIWVRARRSDQPTFFARVLGTDSFSTDAEAIAMYRPRDIMLVLDYSASMNDDSELRHIGAIGQENVEANLQRIYTELGAPEFGTMQWDPVHITSDSSTVIASRLGLTRVPYPYPSGSWSDYFYYVRTNGYINNAGYRKDYGYLTFVNYLLEKRPKHDQTPILHQTSEQPITAVKDAVRLFLAYLQEVDTADRLGLSTYTYSDGTGRLEVPLTRDFQVVEDTSRERQAGHYDYYTNISAGMRKAREELEEHARPGALKMIVLMTDGIANRPSNETAAKAAAIDEAHYAAANRYPIVTISLGSGADTDLMDAIASITGGVHFNIPGGQPVSGYEQDLKDVFRKIADDRPLKLVK